MRKREIIAVGGGKGGVGKSLLSVNLALALSQLGKSVVIVDGDLGSANCHTLLGITRIEKSIEEYLKEELSLDQVAVPTRFAHLSLICGAANKMDVYLERPNAGEHLLRDVVNLDYDYIVLDLGAGMSDVTLDLYNLSHSKIIAVTPQFTSLQNAYSFVKSAFFRSLSQHESLNEYLPQMSDPVVFRKIMMELAPHIEARKDYEAALQDQKFKIAGNMISAKTEVAIIKKMSVIVKEFLDIDSAEFGIFTQSHDVQSSINKLTPFLELFPNDENSRELKRIARTMDGQPAEVPVRGWWKFWQAAAN
ncbi:P-loop NTPase [Bdellovibrionota bacterium FG-2]